MHPRTRQVKNATLSSLRKSSLDDNDDDYDEGTVASAPRSNYLPSGMYLSTGVYLENSPTPTVDAVLSSEFFLASLEGTATHANDSMDSQSSLSTIFTHKSIPTKKKITVDEIPEVLNPASTAPSATFNSGIVHEGGAVVSQTMSEETGSCNDKKAISIQQEQQQMDKEDFGKNRSSAQQEPATEAAVPDHSSHQEAYCVEENGKKETNECQDDQEDSINNSNILSTTIPRVNSGLISLSNESVAAMAKAQAAGDNNSKKSATQGSNFSMKNNNINQNNYQSSATSLMSLQNSQTSFSSELKAFLVAPSSDTDRMRRVLSENTGVGGASARDLLTINKLRFNALVGRKQEQEVMQQCLQRAMAQQSRELILISGQSGTGKTALALTLRPRSTKKTGTAGLVVHGKFDLFIRQPYSGIAKACHELCEALLELRQQEEDQSQQQQQQRQSFVQQTIDEVPLEDEYKATSHGQKFDRICQRLVQELDEDIELLMKMIPKLSEVLGGLSFETAKAAQPDYQPRHKNSNSLSISNHNRKKTNNHHNAPENPHGSSSLQPPLNHTTNSNNINNHRKKTSRKIQSVSLHAIMTPKRETSIPAELSHLSERAYEVQLEDNEKNSHYLHGNNNNNNNGEEGVHQLGLQEAKKRIQHVFSQFFAVICEFYPCLILQLDDLQWGDTASLSLLQVLLTNTLIKNFLVVGCYRSNEVQNDPSIGMIHPVNQMIHNLQNKSDSIHNINSEPEENEKEPLRKSNFLRNSLLRGSISAEFKNNNSNSSNSKFHLTRIWIGNLQEHHVVEILMDVLSATDENQELLALANLCFRKTHGNAFFLIQFIMHLQQQELLRYNFNLLKWIWSDEAEIQAQTESTANVVDLVKSNMASLPNTYVIELLPILGCLGSSFQQDIAQLVWTAYIREQRTSSIENSLRSEQEIPALGPLLDIAAEEGFLERLSSGNNKTTQTRYEGDPNHKITAGSSQCSFKFVHDSIQEAAVSLADPKTLPKLKSTLGRILVDELDARGKATSPETDPLRLTLESYLFAAVNLLNEGLPPISEKDRFELSELNLRAAKRAIEFSAFTSTSSYLLQGINLLPHGDKKWNDEYYPLTLELYSSTVEVFAYSGNVEDMQILCNEVLAQKSRPLVDKFRVYNVMQGSMFNRSKEDEAIDLGLSLLRKLDCKFPKTKAGIALSTNSGIARAKALLDSKTLENKLAQLPVLSDPMKLEAMHLLDKTSLYCLFSRGNMVPLLVLKMVQRTMTYGLCEYAPPAFANLGFLLAGVVEDFEAAAQMADMTLKMMDQIPCRNTKARTILLLHWAVFPWSRPLRTLLTPFLHGYREGLSTGDTESALWCIHNYVSWGLLCGRNLALLDDDTSVYLKNMLLLEQHKIGKYTQILRQMILNLRGIGSFQSAQGSMPGQRGENETLKTKSTNPISGIGDDDVEIDEPLMYHQLKCYQNRMYALFGDYEKSAELSISRGDEFLRGFAGNCLHMGDAFYRALSLYAMARKRQEPIDASYSQMCLQIPMHMSSTRGADAKRYKRQAKHHHSIIKMWAKKGNLNVLHYDRILDAEHAALNRKDTEAKNAYQTAIVMSAKFGFIQDAAIASERLALFLLREVKDEENAIFRLEQAIRFYTEWGFHVKADQIKEEYAGILNP